MMRRTIYDRIPQLPTKALFDLRSVWMARPISNERPRHDYIGKCVIRATLVLERRGALPHPTAAPIRKRT